MTQDELKSLLTFFTENTATPEEALEDIYYNDESPADVWKDALRFASTNDEMLDILFRIVKTSSIRSDMAFAFATSFPKYKIFAIKHISGEFIAKWAKQFPEDKDEMFKRVKTENSR